MSNSRTEREKLLEGIWSATAKAILTSLENPDEAEHRAAMINVARQFLSDNHVDNSSLDQIGDTKKATLDAMLADLPDDEPATVAPLHSDSERQRAVGASAAQLESVEAFLANLPD